MAECTRRVAPCAFGTALCAVPNGARGRPIAAIRHNNLALAIKLAQARRRSGCADGAYGAIGPIPVSPPGRPGWGSNQSACWLAPIEWLKQNCCGDARLRPLRPKKFNTKYDYHPRNGSPLIAISTNSRILRYKFSHENSFNP